MSDSTQIQQRIDQVYAPDGTVEKFDSVPGLKEAADELAERRRQSSTDPTCRRLLMRATARRVR
jgi:hypothetical protein